MAWSYKKYSDSTDTKNADKNRQTIYNQKPGAFTYADYQESQAVKDWYNKMNSLKKPGAFSFTRQSDYDSVIDKYLNRDPFSYDVNGDALYQQYKDQYVTLGKQGMMDTIGQASAMTGGYGNSYAQSAGQQTYQGYLQQLTDKIPELYQLALSKYNQEGEDLYNQYGMLSDAYSKEYGEHRDKVSDYYTDRDYYTNQYNTERQWDYGLWSDGYDRAYNLHRDEVSDWQYLLNRSDNEYWNNKNFDWDQYSSDKEYSYKLNRDEIEDNQWQQEYNLNQSQIDFEALEKKYEGYLSPEEVAQLQQAQSSEATQLFKSSLPSGREWARFANGDGTYTYNGKRYSSQTEAIGAIIDRWVKDGKLTGAEEAYLKGYYGIDVD